MASSEVKDDYYATLEVVQTATFETIKASYRKLAIKLHPDKNPNDPGATKAFQRLGNAWDTLQDSVKRRAYDRDYQQIRKAHETAERARKAEAEAAKAKREQQMREDAARERERQAAAQAAKEKSDREAREERELRELEVSIKTKSEEYSKQKRILDDNISKAFRKIQILEAELNQIETADSACGPRLSAPVNKKKTRKEQERLERIRKKNAMAMAVADQKRKLEEWEMASRQGANEIDCLWDRYNGLEWKKAERLKAEEEAKAREKIRIEREEQAKRDKEAQNRKEAEKREQLFERMRRREAEKKERKEGERRERERREREYRERERRERERREREDREREDRERERRKREEEKEELDQERRYAQRKAREAAAYAAEKDAEYERRYARRKATEAAAYAAEKDAEYERLYGSSSRRSRPSYSDEDEYDSTRSRKSYSDRRPRNERRYTPSPDSDDAANPSSCLHKGYWPRVYKAGECKNCFGFREDYLYQCPGCGIKTCGQCCDTLNAK